MPWFSSHIHCLLKSNVKHIICFHVIFYWRIGIIHIVPKLTNIYSSPEKDSVALSSLHLIPLQCTGEAGTSEDANTIFIFFQSELRQTISNLEKTRRLVPPTSCHQIPLKTLRGCELNLEGCARGDLQMGPTHNISSGIKRGSKTRTVF